MLVVGWYDMTGEHSANAYCRQYFEVKLDEDTRGAFSSLSSEQQQQSSDSDDDTTSGRKRKSRGKGGAKAGSKTQEAIGGLVEAIRSLCEVRQLCFCISTEQVAPMGQWVPPKPY